MTRFRLRLVIILLAIFAVRVNFASAQASMPWYSEKMNPIAEIAMVGIDANTLYYIGSGSGDGEAYRGSFPLERNWYAKFISELSKAGAKMVVFNIYFNQEWNSPTSRAFADAVKNASMPVIVSFEKVPHPYPNTVDPDLKSYSLSRIGPKNVNSEKALSLAFPFKEILAAGALIGYSRMVEDADGIVRSVPAFVGYNNYVFPSLSVRTFIQAVGAAPQDATVSGYGANRSLNINGRKISITQADTIQVAIPPHNTIFKSRSFYDVMNVKDSYKKDAKKTHQKKLKEWFEDKIVFVGFTDLSLGDLKRTTAGVGYPGTEIIAAAVNQMLNIYAGPNASPAYKKKKSNVKTSPATPPRNTDVDIAVEEMKKNRK